MCELFFRLRTFFPTSEDNRPIACLHAGCFDFRENDFEVVAVKFFNVTQARRVEFGFDYVGLTRLFFRRRDIRFSMSFEVLVCAGEMCYNVRGDSDLQDNESTAMRQCGLENFTIEVIEMCETQLQANDSERFNGTASAKCFCRRLRKPRWTCSRKKRI